MFKIVLLLLIGLGACKTPRRHNLTVSEPHPAQEAPEVMRLDATKSSFDSSDNPIKKGALFRITSELEIADFAFDRTNGAMYAANLAGGVYLSKDNGQSWLSLGGGQRCRQVLPATQSVIYAICDDHVLKRTLQAEVWQTLSLPFGPKNSVIPEKISFSSARPNRLYVAGRGEADHNNLFFTDDQGDHWDSIGSVTMLDDDGTRRQLTAVDEFVLGFAIHPTQPDLVVALLTYGVFVSVDAGKNFFMAGLLDQSLTIPSKNVSKNTVLHTSKVQFDAVDAKTVYALSENSLNVSRDAGVSWQVYPQTDPLRVFSVHPNKAGVLYAQSEANTFLVSFNFGQTWAPIMLVNIDGASKSFFNSSKSISSVSGSNFLQVDHSLLVSPTNGRIFGASQKGYGVIVGIE